jgi:hypothetical protein
MTANQRSKNLSLLEIRHIDEKFPKNTERVKAIIDGIRELAKRVEDKPGVDKPSNVGNSKWLKSVTGWSIQKISHVCTSQNVPGAFRSGKGRGARWSFRKNLTLSWIESGCPAKR